MHCHTNATGTPWPLPPCMRALVPGYDNTCAAASMGEHKRSRLSEVSMSLWIRLCNHTYIHTSLCCKGNVQVSSELVGAAHSPHAVTATITDKHVGARVRT